MPHLDTARNVVTLKVFDPVATLLRTDFYVAVPADSRWATMADVIGAATAAPGRIRFDTFALKRPGWSAEKIERRAAAKSKVDGELVRRKNISLE